MADYNLNSFDMENTFSSWLDGTLSPEEEAAFMNFCASNLEMQEIMEANDVYSYDELSNVEDADNDNYDLSAHVSDGGDYEQDESYDDFDLL